MMETNTAFRQFIRYTIPNVCGMIGLSCYILADTFFVARGLGADGLAALNLAIPVYSFIHGSGLLLGMGGATRYSIFRGQKAHQAADQVFSHVLHGAALLSVLFLGLGLFLSGPIAALLGATEEVFAMTRTYLQVLLLFSPAFLLNDILICFVRNDNGPRLAMAAMLAGSFANILMDYLFIFPLHMGIAGAVLATGFAPVIGVGIISRHFIQKKNHFSYDKKVPLSLGQFLPVVSLGMSSLITELASGIVMIVFNILILGLTGNVGVAAYGVVANLSLVVTSIHTGIAQGLQPIASRACGQGDRTAMEQVLRYAMGVMLLLSLGIYVAFLALADPIVSCFNSAQDGQLQQIGTVGLKLYFTAMPFAGANIILSMYMASVAKPLPAQIISLARGLLVILPAAILLARLLGMTGVWLAYPVAEGLVTGIGAALYICRNVNKTVH